MKRWLFGLAFVLALSVVSHAQIGNIFTIRGCDEVFNEIEDYEFNNPGSITINSVRFIGYFYGWGVYEYGFTLTDYSQSPRTQQNYIDCIQ